MNIIDSIRNRIINKIIDREGGYVNDPGDAGGETNWGITVATARENGYFAAMADLPKSTAFNIYRNQYWDSVKGDALAEISEKLVSEVVDTAVNTGLYQSSISLQRMLNALNGRQRLYADIEEDGIIGSGTLNALKGYNERRDIDVLLTGLNALQGAYYILLAERKDSQEKFLYGWLKNRVKF